MAYEASNRGDVMKYLTRQVGFMEAKQYWDTRTIPPEYMECIETCVLATRGSKRSDARAPIVDVYTDDTVRDHAIRYVKRAYGEVHGMERWNGKALTEYDLKMIRTMTKLHGAYASIHDDRRATRLTTYQEMHTEGIQTDIVEKKSAPKTKKTNKDPVNTVTTCRAYKLDGTQCTAKTKNGSGFCVRHTKKEAPSSKIT